MVSEETFDESDEPPEPDEILDDDDDDNDEDDDANMVLDDSSVDEEFVEFDPSGRYGRYAEVLGRGAMKTVYRAYDMVDCKEVAWNKARPLVECSDEQAFAVQREIDLLRQLNHKGIIKLYSTWGNDATGHTDFITELCSSTLLEYRMTHKHISRKAVKSWGRQILQGLAHLHTQDPPIIHRDLKCENIFVKCRSNTALKIGDFGSATFLDETHHMHTLVGTPEFMAPEMFQEDYNELVDVYSFGMCMLELLTRECPYSECKSLGQIYKKVINGEKPKGLYKVTDAQALRLINRCLLPACKRPSASELLGDPFLQCQGACTGSGQSLKSFNSMPDLRGPNDSYGVKNMLSSQGAVGKLSRPIVAPRRKSGSMAHADVDPSLRKSTDHGGNKALCAKSPSFRRTYRVTGRVEDLNTLRLKIRIQESSRSCDIDFPFDLRYDSPRSVAEEMVRALEYSESDMHTIAVLISKEIAALVPNFEERSKMGSAPLDLGGSFAENCLRGDLNASQSGAEVSIGRSSYSSTGKFDCIANPIAQPMNGEACAGDGDCAKIGASLANGKIGNSVHGISCNDMMSLSDDKCCDGMASPAGGRQLGITTSEDSDPMQVGDECSGDLRASNCSSAQAADEITSKLSCDKPSANSGINWGLFNRLHAKASAGRSQNAYLTRSASQKSSSRFKQLPAGIGVLLWPSSEQGLRRALPSCVNAFA